MRPVCAAGFFSHLLHKYLHVTRQLVSENVQIEISKRPGYKLSSKRSCIIVLSSQVYILICLFAGVTAYFANMVASVSAGLCKAIV